jgi:hypothetical protein
MLVKVLRTPTDFEATMGTEDYVVQKWISLPAELEPDVRGTIDEIFEDLQYIGSDDPGLTAAYLEGIFEPLQRLKQFGLQLVGFATSGNMTFPAETLGSDTKTTAPWRRSIYVVAPTLATTASSPRCRRRCTSSASIALACAKSRSCRTAALLRTARSNQASKTTRASCPGARRASCRRVAG